MIESYKAPDINFLSKPELNKDNAINQDELKFECRKAKKCFN